MLANIEKEEISIIKNCRVGNYESELIAKSLDSCNNNSNVSKSDNKYYQKYN